jgi:hypothetical protein
MLSTAEPFLALCDTAGGPRFEENHGLPRPIRKRDKEALTQVLRGKNRSFDRWLAQDLAPIPTISRGVGKADRYSWTTDWSP